MQKSGTAFIYHMINSLVAHTIGHDARKVKAKYGVGKFMKGGNHNIGDLSPSKVLRLWWVSLLGKSYVVKTHSGRITRTLRFLLKARQVKIIYIYRDPRDVLLSVMDHGAKIRAKGKNHTFARWDTFDKAFNKLKGYLKNFRNYNGNNLVMTVRYEDLISDPSAVMKKIAHYLGIEPNLELIDKILKENNVTDKFHFNKGVAGRYKESMTPKQIGRFEEVYGETMIKMGYNP